MGTMMLDTVDDATLDGLASGRVWPRQSQGMAMASELLAVRAFLTPLTGPTVHDRLAELHDLLCTISARCDADDGIWDDLQTAIGWAETLTDEAEAVTP